MIRVLGFCGGRRLRNQSFIADGTWIAPATTTRLETLQGQGAGGSPPSINSTGPVSISVVTYNPGWTGPSSGNVGWATINNQLNGWRAVINNGGTGSVAQDQWTQGPSSYTQTQFTQPYTDAVAGSCTVSYTGAWQTSGSVSTSGDGFLTWNYYGAATTGAAATAFGYTFPGGVGVPATSFNYTNVAVTPGASYNIIVPSGASVSITWFE